MQASQAIEKGSTITFQGLRRQKLRPVQEDLGWPHLLFYMEGVAASLQHQATHGERDPKLDALFRNPEIRAQAAKATREQAETHSQVQQPQPPTRAITATD